MYSVVVFVAWGTNGDAPGLVAFNCRIVTGAVALV
jgi:hypothetical protein